MEHLRGWVDDQREVNRIWESMPTPFFQAPAVEDRDQHNHLIFKQMVGDWPEAGPQTIGDCTSWGNGRLVNYTNVLEMYSQLHDAAPTQEALADAIEKYEYQATATEVIYALARINVGHGAIRGDGAVGAWVAKALTDFGSISRSNLDKVGVGGAYSGSRARQWGAQGLPSNLIPLAVEHLMGDMTPVRNFNDLKFHIQNLRVVAVCSNVGFENAGSGSATRRDAQGFATPRGQWGHCMTFVSVKAGGRPGALLQNQWPPEMVQGPMGDVEIPPCSWWVDAEVVDSMLGQNDSFTGSKFKGYPVRKLTWRI